MKVVNKKTSQKKSATQKAHVDAEVVCLLAHISHWAGAEKLLEQALAVVKRVRIRTAQQKKAR